MVGSRKIKGYYPFPISLPRNNNNMNETYLYIKEHKGKGINNDNKTLFVTNAPYMRGIKTSLLLKSIFNRFGDVEDVTVIENARDNINDSSNLEDSGLILKDDRYAWIEDKDNEGKYAHVIFVSKDDLKNALQAIFYSKEGKKGASIDEEEISNLKSQSNNNDMDDNDNDGKECKCKLLKRYQQNKPSRDKLMDECNKIMITFQQLEEEEKRQQSLETNNKPDDDGFIAVTYNTKNISKVGTKTTMETPIVESAANGTQVMMKRRKSSKRSRNSNNKVKGSQELADFYKFQMRDSRKRNVDDLKTRFEEDLANVKKLKAMKQYRPF